MMRSAIERQTSERDCGGAPHGACRAQALAVRDAERQGTPALNSRGGFTRPLCLKVRRWGFGPGALSGWPNNPSIARSGSISSSRQPYWLAIRDISSLCGSGELSGRCSGIGRIFFTPAGAHVAAVRLNSNSPHHFACQGADAAKNHVPCLSSAVSLRINRSERRLEGCPVFPRMRFTP